MPNLSLDAFLANRCKFYRLVNARGMHVKVLRCSQLVVVIIVTPLSADGDDDDRLVIRSVPGAMCSDPLGCIGGNRLIDSC